MPLGCEIKAKKYLANNVNIVQIRNYVYEFKGC